MDFHSQPEKIDGAALSCLRLGKNITLMRLTAPGLPLIQAKPDMTSDEDR